MPNNEFGQTMKFTPQKFTNLQNQKSQIGYLKTRAVEREDESQIYKTDRKLRSSNIGSKKVKFSTKILAYEMFCPLK